MVAAAPREQGWRQLFLRRNGALHVLFLPGRRVPINITLHVVLHCVLQ